MLMGLVFLFAAGVNEATLNNRRYITAELSDGTVVYMQVANTDSAGKQALARVEQQYKATKTTAD